MANGTLNSSSGGARRPWITTLVILLVIFIAVGAFVELRPRRIRISVVKPVRQEVASSIITNGKVEPIHGFEAHAPLSGTVQKMLVKEGAQVRAGQLLLVLDDTRARGDLANALTRLKGAQERYENLLAGGDRQQIILRKADLQKSTTEIDSAQRQLSALERLQQRGAATPEEVAAARDRLNRAQADLTQLQAPVRYSPEQQARARSEVADSRANVDLNEEIVRSCNVRAPFDGTVYSLPVRADAWVNAGDMLLQEADLSQLQVRAFVDEPEIGRLAIGQAVRITWEALPGHTWQGSVTTLPSTVVNRGSRVVGEIFCKIDNSERLLLPNVNVNATIIANSRQNALTVPREAVRQDGSHSFVFVVQDGRLSRRDVKLGISNLTRVEILSGISESDVIAVQSFSPVPMLDGVAVKIVENPS
ncbi:MAG: efflux RND transporter periplasmic adaptor subunit [Candidatus Korobacteraceae bacterium]|jgi:HlyD family secretion protein